jgi:cysteine desulfurase
MHEETIYLDYNATTPCAREVLDAMLPFFHKNCANASSPHAMGKEVARAVANARVQVATAIGSLPEEVYFTSGATESNNMVLLGLVNRSHAGRRIVLSAIEHKSVLEPCGWLSEQGFDVVEIPVTRDGVADVEAAAQLVNDNTLLVSVQGANNEIGTLQPVRAIADIAHARKALVHCDASQMLGKVPVSVDEMRVDFASFSGHKVYGPKGIGVLYVRRGIARSAIQPLLRGGGQESQLRPGTLNVPGIVGFGEACRVALQSLGGEMSRLQRLRDLFEEHLLARVPDAFVIGTGAERLPGTSSICFPAAPADALIARMPRVCVSTGSACTAGAISPSHVLLACGYSRDIARCVIRTSLGRYTVEGEIDYAVNVLAKAVDLIRCHCTV